MGENTLKISDIPRYVLERFDCIKSKPSMNKLVQFHTTNKYLLMAFSPIHLNKMGNVVANHEKLSASAVVGNYSDCLIVALGQHLTRSKHANVLRRMYGHFYKKLSKQSQEIIERQIFEYQHGKNQLSDTLRNLTVHTMDLDSIYLARQSYFLLFSDKKAVWRMF
ncbi:MAG: YbgA family protein [Nitrosopumilus sp.]|nr:YbgA family protein [Nitrosopumilus sp.]